MEQKIIAKPNSIPVKKQDKIVDNELAADEFAENHRTSFQLTTLAVEQDLQDYINAERKRGQC